MADILTIMIGALLALGIVRTGMMQVREFRLETGEDAWLTRILALEFHAPETVEAPCDDADVPSN